MGVTLGLLVLRRQGSSLPLAIAPASLAVLGLVLLLRYIIDTPAPTPKMYNLAALLFIMALLGGLVLLALRVGRREFRTPAPMFVVVLHAILGVVALLLLAVGYTHNG
jgi:hypothetical protein